MSILLCRVDRYSVDGLARQPRFALCAAGIATFGASPQVAGPKVRA
jgi:hypothetical protein